MKFLFFIVFLSGQSVKGQIIATSDGNDLKFSISIGAHLPDVRICKMNNRDIKSTTSTFAFRDKLLIIDFFATHCSPCVAKFPLFDSLQNVFAEKVQFLIVTREREETVKKLLANIKIMNQISHLHFVTDDRLLRSYFPHRVVSHVAWIYKGKVRAITGAEYVNAKNIELVLSDQTLNWPIKRDATNYDYNEPLMTVNKSGIPEISLVATNYYSTITGHMDGVRAYSSYDRKARSNYIWDSAKNSFRLLFINTDIINLYQKAYGYGLRKTLEPSRVIMEVKDKSKYILSNKTDYRGEWDRENTFCYEAIFPFNSSVHARNEKFRNDLNFYLGLNGRMELRRVKCYILIRMENRKSNLDSLLQKNVEREISVRNTDGDDIEQVSLSKVINNINQHYSGVPAFNETYYPEERYLKLSKKQTENVELLKLALCKYGLELKEEERDVEMLVITENEK